MFEDTREVEQFQSIPRRPRWVLPVTVMLVVAVIGGIIISGRNPEPVPEPPPVLSEPDRRSLWDAEHAGLLLSNSGWRPLVSALAKSDREAITDQMDDSFIGRIPENWLEDGIEETGLAASRRSGADASQDLAGNEFLDWMLGIRRDLAASVGGRFKLTAIRPADRLNVVGDWLGSGRLTLEGVSEAGEPRFETISLTFRTVQPTEENLMQGGWLRGCEIERIDRGASSGYLMREVARERGLEPERLHDNWTSESRQIHTGGIYCCDYNRDGCVDVLVTDMHDRQGLILYRGSPEGSFDDVSASVDLPAVSNAVDAIFADLDGDCWEDLIVPGQLVLQNDSGQRFVDVTDLSNLDDLIYAKAWEGGLDGISGVSVADFNLDGRIDLYVTRADVSGFNTGSWIDGSSGDGIGNQLLQNTGNWEFVDRTHTMNADGDARSVFASVWLDANDDSYPDVYVIHEFGPGVLLVNQRGRRFEAVDIALESSDFGSMGLTCGDIDNDGLVDVYVSNMYSSAGNRVMDNLPPDFYNASTTSKLRRMVAGNQLHRNLGELQFAGVAEEWGIQQVGWGWGPSLADLNNDGWLDIYATCGFMSRERQKPDG